MKKVAFALFCFLIACSRSTQSDLQPALETINSGSLLNEIKTLSADDFEGRAPGTSGEEKTIAYLQRQFQQIGLAPGNPNGTFLQNVPLAGVTSKTEAQFTVKGKRLPSANLKDYVAVSRRYTPKIDVKNSEIVFVG